MTSTEPAWQERAAALAVAMGRAHPDLILKGGRIVNVYSGEILAGGVAVKGSRMVAVGPDLPAPGPATRVIDVGGSYLIPGLIEPHTHPWIYYNPATLAAYAARCGTTTIACDTLMFIFRGGWDGLRRVIDACAGLPARLLWWIRLIPNNAMPGTDGDWQAGARQAFAWPEVVGMAELPHWLRIAGGDPEIQEGLAAALAHGKRVDGHTAGASPGRLQALAAAGVSGCHEGITGPEVLARLRLGYWTVLRFSSLRPDLPELVAYLVKHGVDTRRLSMTTDGPTPDFLVEHGLVAGAVRQCIAAGVPPVQALQMATVNTATYLRRDDDLGGLAPGRYADLCVVDDLRTLQPRLVLTAGRVVAEDGQGVTPPSIPWSELLPHTAFPPAAVLARPQLFAARPAPGLERFPVARFESTVITRRQDMALPVRDGCVDLSDYPELSHAAIMDVEGRWVARAVVAGLVPGADGIAHICRGSNLLLVTGRCPTAMAQAAAAVRNGGTAVVQDGRVACHLPAPEAGFMSAEAVPALARRYEELAATARRLGYTLGDLDYSLDFLTVDFLPELRLGPRGWVEVKSDRVLIPPEQIPPERR